MVIFTYSKCAMKSSQIKTEQAELRKDWLIKNNKNIDGMSFSKKKDLIKEYNEAVSMLLQKSQNNPTSEDIERIREALDMPKRIPLAQAVAFIKTLMSYQWDDYKQKYAEYCQKSFFLDDMRKIMMFDNDVKEARIDTDIYHQTHETNRSIVEIISNAVDALNKQWYNIWRFGVWFYQILSHLKSVDDKVIVSTGNPQNWYYQIAFRNNKWAIELHIKKIDEQWESWTTVELISRNFDKTDSDNLVKKHLLYNQTAKIYLNGEYINNLAYLWFDGKDLPIVNIQTTDKWYIVDDNGAGMSPEIILEKLLVPKVSGKKPIYEIDASIIPTPTYMVERQPLGAQWGFVSLQVWWILIEEIPIKGINTVKNLIVDLPPFTLLGEERNSIAVDEITIQAMKKIIDNVFQSKQYDIINTLSYAVEQLQKRSTNARKENNLINYMKESAEKYFDKDSYYLPNVSWFERVKWENTILINPNVKTTHINRIPYIKSIELSDDGLPIYITDLESDAEYLFILTKDFALLDQKTYENHKNDPALLNLYIKKLTEWLGKEDQTQIELKKLRKQEKTKSDESKEIASAKSFSDFFQKNHKEFEIQTQDTAEYMYDTLSMERKEKATIIYEKFIKSWAYNISIKLIKWLFAWYLDHFSNQDLINRWNLKDNQELLQILETFNARFFIDNEWVYDEFPNRKKYIKKYPYDKSILSVEYGNTYINIMPDGTYIRWKIIDIKWIDRFVCIFDKNNEMVSLFDLKENKAHPTKIQLNDVLNDDWWFKQSLYDWGITLFKDKYYFFYTHHFGCSGGNIDPWFLLQDNDPKKDIVWKYPNKSYYVRWSNSGQVMMYDIDTWKPVEIHPELWYIRWIRNDSIVFSKFHGQIPEKVMERYKNASGSEKEIINSAFFWSSDDERKKMRWTYTQVNNSGEMCKLSPIKEAIIHIDNKVRINESHESLSSGLEVVFDTKTKKLEISKNGQCLVSHDMSETEYDPMKKSYSREKKDNRCEVDTINTNSKRYYVVFINANEWKVAHQYLFDESWVLLGDFISQWIFINGRSLYWGAKWEIRYLSDFYTKDYFNNLPWKIDFKKICLFLDTKSTEDMQKSFFIPYNGQKDNTVPSEITQIIEEKDDVMWCTTTNDLPMGKWYEYLNKLLKIKNRKVQFRFQEEAHYARGYSTEAFQIYDQNDKLIDANYYNGIDYDEQKKCFILSSVSYYRYYGKDTNQNNWFYGNKYGNSKRRVFKEYQKSNHRGTYMTHDDIITDTALYISEDGTILWYKEIEDMAMNNSTYPGFYDVAKMDIEKGSDYYFGSRSRRDLEDDCRDHDERKHIKGILALWNNIKPLNRRKMNHIQHILESCHNGDVKQIERFISRCFRYGNLEDDIFAKISTIFFTNEYLNYALIKPNIIAHISGLLKNYDENNQIRFWKFLSKLISDKNEIQNNNFIDKFYKIFCDKFIYMDDSEKSKVFDAFELLREYNGVELYTWREIIRHNIKIPLEHIHEKIRPIIFYLLQGQTQAQKNNLHEDIEFTWAYQIRLSSLIQAKRLSEYKMQNIWWDISQFAELVNTKTIWKKIDHIQREIIHPIYYQNIDNAYLFIRELVQNAHDAVIMQNWWANKSVNINIYSKAENQVSVSIEDNVGMNLQEFINYFLVPWESTKVNVQEAIWYFGQWLFTLFKWAKEVTIKTSKWDGTINYFQIKPFFDGVGIIIDLDIQMRQEKGNFKWSWIEKTIETDFPEVEMAYIQNSIYSYTGLVDANIIHIMLNDQIVNKSIELLASQEMPNLWMLKIYNAPNNVITRRWLYIKPIDEDYKTKMIDVENLLNKKWYVISIPDQIAITRSGNDIACKKEIIDQIQKYLPSLKVKAYLEIFRQDIMKWHVIQLDNLPYDYFYAPIASNNQIREDAKAIINWEIIKNSDLYIDRWSLIELLVLLPVVEIDDVYYSMEQLVESLLNNTAPLDKEGNIRKVPLLIRKKLLEGKDIQSQNSCRSESEKGTIVGDFRLEDLEKQPAFIQSKIKDKLSDYQAFNLLSETLNQIGESKFDKKAQTTFYNDPNSQAHASRFFGILWRNLNYRSWWKIHDFQNINIKDFANLREFYDVRSHEYTHLIEDSNVTHNESFVKKQAKVLAALIDYFSKQS